MVYRSTQNGGRQKSYEEAEAMGIKIQKEWMSAKDNRVRDSHAQLNGVRVRYNKTFPNGCRYPGDPSGRPEEVYNCRCTMVAITPNASQKKRTGNTVASYKKWKNQKVADEEIYKSSERGIIESDLGIFKQKLRKDNVEKEYYQVLKDKFSHGKDDAKRVFSKYAAGNTIANSGHEGVAMYDTEKKKIFMHFGADLINSRGAGATWFHEHGHLIDDMAGVVSKNNNFKDLLQQDAVHYIRQFAKTKGIKDAEQVYKLLGEGLQDMRKHSAVSDLFSGLTNDSVKGCAKHSNDYWEEPDNITSEAFAHMFEAQFDSVRYVEMEKYFPKALKFFEDTLLKGIK